MKPFPSHRSFAALMIAALSLGSAQAATGSFLERFEGTWSGSGSVQRNAEENPHRVQCTLAGTHAADALSIQGTCRAAVVFTRQIKVDIRANPSGSYSGTYIGSKIGPASLSGKQRGDAVVLNITWPKPVNGDRTATMTIRNSGAGQMEISVTDLAAPGGPTVKTTELVLAQR